MAAPAIKWPSKVLRRKSGAGARSASVVLPARVGIRSGARLSFIKIHWPSCAVLIPVPGLHGRGYERSALFFVPDRSFAPSVGRDVRAQVAGMSQVGRALGAARLAVAALTFDNMQSLPPICAQ